MGNRATSLFCSVLFNKFHHRTNLIALFFRIFVFKRKLQSQNYEILSTRGMYHTYNGKMKILFSEFHHRTNLTAPLLSNLGSKNKLLTQNFEICKFKGLLHILIFKCYFEFLRVQYDESIHAPD
jgi:hypothetical protein